MEFQELEKKLVILVLIIALSAKYGIVIPFIILLIVGGKFLFDGIGITFFSSASRSNVKAYNFFTKEHN